MYGWNSLFGSKERIKNHCFLFPHEKQNLSISFFWSHSNCFVITNNPGWFYSCNFPMNRCIIWWDLLLWSVKVDYCHHWCFGGPLVVDFCAVVHWWIMVMLSPGVVCSCAGWGFSLWCAHKRTVMVCRCTDDDGLCWGERYFFCWILMVLLK